MIELEQKLIRKNFIRNEKSNDTLFFYKKYDMTSQVNIQQKENKYRVSFPMSNDTIHYSTSFDSLQDATKYLNYVVDCNFR